MAANGGLNDTPSPGPSESNSGDLITGPAERSTTAELDAMVDSLTRTPNVPSGRKVPASSRGPSAAPDKVLPPIMGSGTRDDDDDDNDGGGMGSLLGFNAERRDSAYSLGDDETADVLQVLLGECIEEVVHRVQNAKRDQFMGTAITTAEDLKQTGVLGAPGGDGSSQSSGPERGKNPNARPFELMPTPTTSSSRKKPVIKGTQQQEQQFAQMMSAPVYHQSVVSFASAGSAPTMTNSNMSMLPMMNQGQGRAASTAQSHGYGAQTGTTDSRPHPMDLATAANAKVPASAYRCSICGKSAHCFACNLSFSSDIQHDEHNQGRKHKQMVEQCLADGVDIFNPTVEEPFVCTVCRRDYYCMPCRKPFCSQMQMQDHLRGRKHKKVVAKMEHAQRQRSINGSSATNSEFGHDASSSDFPDQQQQPLGSDLRTGSHGPFSHASAPRRNDGSYSQLSQMSGMTGMYMANQYASAFTGVVEPHPELPKSKGSPLVPDDVPLSPPVPHIPIPVAVGALRSGPPAFSIDGSSFSNEPSFSQQSTLSLLQSLQDQNQDRAQQAAYANGAYSRDSRGGFHPRGRGRGSKPFRGGTRGGARGGSGRGSRGAWRGAWKGQIS